jgi:2,3-bisphosphoglycerate-independent phosphoglycerate mutase
VGRVLFIFLDGVGIGSREPERNPFFLANLPILTGALGNALPHLEEPRVDGAGGTAFPLDACLGVEGTPQSGTGQVALLTGQNAPRTFGRHFGPWPPVRLRPILERENFLSRARATGLRVVFANAYPRGYPGERDSRKVAAFPLAARAAGVLDRDHDALGDGTAVASEIVNDGWIQHLGFAHLPAVTEEEAGRNLALLAGEADLTVYTHYQTDVAGHRGGVSGAVEALERVDRFLGGVLGALPDDMLLLAASDHGNIEDLRAEHTRNPALGLVLGAVPPRLREPRTIAGVADVILSRLEG